MYRMGIINRASANEKGNSMKRLYTLLCFVLISSVAILVVTKMHAQSAGTASAEDAIRNAAAEFTKAFDQGDAEALANHFTADGVYINEAGLRFEGRDAIRQEYAKLFQVSTGLKLKMEIDSIRQISPTTVVEEGRAALTPQPPGASRVMSAYTAVHTLQDGQWLMAHVSDTRVELPPDTGQLEDLDWLVGTWVAERNGTRVEIKGRWIEDKHFLARSHSVAESGQVTSTGLDIIGIDPATGKITSWHFTSDGGHAIGRWAPHDNGWLIELTGTTLGGVETIAVNNLSQKDNGTLVFNSINRWVGDATLPDIQAITIKRQQE